jgi:hypothetical protein
MTGMNVLGIADTIEAFTSLKNAALDDRDAVYIVGTNVEYAAYVEFGTSTQEAQPYLRPAVRRVARNPGKHVGDVDSTGEMVRKTALAIERLAKQDAPVDTGRLQNSIEAERVR